MANVTTSNPFVCDSTGALTTDNVTVQAIVWTGTDATNRDIALNDDFQLTDQNSGVIIEKRAAAAGDDLAITFPVPIPYNGLTIGKLDGGICYIYLV